MSILDKKHILTINLDKSSIEFDGNIRFYNTDKNIANLFVKIKKKNSDGADTFLNQSELEGVVLKLTARKPKTNQTREMTGILTEELIDQSCAIYKFELSQEFTDQVGSVVCEFELSNANGEKVTIDSFSYIIKASELTGLNAEIESNPDLPVLKALIEEVKETAQTVNNIDDVNITETKTFSNKKIDEKFSTVSSQIKDIAKQVENVGQPTQQQINTAIDKAIEEGRVTGTGGINSTAQTLLISILRNAVFTSDQSESITLLQSELAKGNSGGSSETTQYAISNNLSNATTSNSTVLVNANASYSATITVNDGYELSAITVTMGGTDITSTAVNGTRITISAVTGNVVITVTTTTISSGGGSTGGEMVTDGLENYFDFRTATYNNNGAGGSTIISATQGNGCLYTWQTNAVTTQDDYGMTITRSMFYNGTSVGTSSTTSLGTSFTVIFKCYLTVLSSPLFYNGYASASNVNKIGYKPKYKTTSGTGNVTTIGLGERKDSGYETLTLMVDGNICKLYFGTELMQTNDGSTIEDFQGWHDQLDGISILGSNNNGYFTQIAVYNKALSEVELVDMLDYLTTLEVK